MTECPELGALETSPLAPELRDHVSSCSSCKLVVEVFDAAAGRLDVDDCTSFDALLAARADGTLGRAGRNLLERHLASCPTCREVAETLSPTQDADGDQENLPQVDPGSYELGLEVARGGMGRVIAARDLRIGRPIAIKELLGRSPQLAARFEREARVTARLQHPGIVPIYEIGKWPDGTPFYSMRMVDGRMLAEAIESGKTLTARLGLLPAVISATEAVAFAHSRRVIHRDLTPSNILVGAYGETVVIDWGLAKDLADSSQEDDDGAALAPENSSERLTGVGAVIGTATYMPPEQAHAVPVDERADVYALGAILYHLCAGGPPYRAKTAKELLRAVKTAPPPPIDQVQPGTPRDLVSIITKAMARDPDARYPSARELAEELKRFQTGRLVEAHVYSRYELFKRFLRRHRAVVIAISLALAIGLTFGIFAVRKIIERGEIARKTVRDLILEKGRIELLAGNPQRALAYLNEAQHRGASGPDVSFLVGDALRGIATTVRALDCGGSNGRAIAFDRTGTLVAAGCHEVAKVWRLVDKEESEIAKFEGDDAGFDGVEFSPDGKLIATWGESGIARVWSLADGKLVATLDHGSIEKLRQRAEFLSAFLVDLGAPVVATEINRLTFTPDGSRVATTGSDGVAIVWDIAQQKPFRALLANWALLRDYASLYGYLSSDGKRLYAMTPDGNGYGWDVETGEPLGKPRQHGSMAIGGDISADDAYGTSCGIDGRVRIWDLEKGVLVHEFAAHAETVWKCIFSPDSKLLLSGGEDGRTNIYDVTSGTVIQSVEPGDIVIDADVTKDGRRFATTGMNGRVKIWDTRSGALVANLDSVRGKLAKFAPDNQHLVAARGDGRLQIWKLDVPAELRTATMEVEIGNSGAHAAFLAGFNALEVRDLATQRAVSTVKDLTGPFAIAESSAFLAAMRGGAIRVVDLASTTPSRDIELDRPPVAMRISSDGLRLVLEYLDAPPEVWDVATRSKLLVLAGATTARLSQRGNRAIAWASGQRPVIWDIDTKSPGVTLASADRFEVVGLAHDGKRAVLRESGETAKKVQLFDADTGALIAERADTSTVTTLDPRHTWLTSIDVNHVVTVWSTIDGSVKYSFLGEQPLLQASVQPNGTFVAAIAEHGQAALLMSATDGRILARWRLDHPKSQISESGGFKAPPGIVTWSSDGANVISRSAAVGIWRVANDFTADEQQDRIKHNVPWRIDEEGKLEWISITLNGTVTRDDEPQANVRVQVVFRAPPDLGVADVNWTSSKNRMQVRDTITNARGEFTIKNLRPGEYTFTVGDTKVTRYVGPEDEPIAIELP